MDRRTGDTHKPEPETGPFVCTPGALDVPFGNEGMSLPLVASGNARAAALAFDSETGDIVTAGWVNHGTDASAELSFVLTRTLSDGIPDGAFGDEGVVVAGSSGDDAFADVALQPDGKIVTAGRTRAGSEVRCAVARYLQDGSPDPSFGAGGMASIPIGTTCRLVAVAVAPDGKIVAAGTSADSGSESHITVLRLASDGKLDDAFAGVGWLQVNVSAGLDEARDLALQPDGAIAVAATIAPHGETPISGMILRFTSAGDPDPSFGDLANGVIVAGNTDARGIAVASDGSFYLSGLDARPPKRIVIAKTSADGALDATFGTGGVVAEAISGYPDLDVARVALQPDGKVLVTGSVQATVGSVALLTRFLPDGKWDTGFGRSGVVAAPELAAGADLIAEPSGRILLAGMRLTENDRQDVFVGRYCQ